MCTYKRWHHLNGAVGKFGVCGGFGELEEGSKGEGRHPCMGL